MKKIFRYAVFPLVLIMVPGFALAQSTVHHTLNSLCKKADKTAEQIKISAADLYIAKQDKKRALAALIPRVDAYGSHSDYMEEDFRNQDTTTYGVRMTQSFTINGKELIAYSASKRTIEQNEFALKRVKSDHLLQVALGYFDTLSAKRLLEIAQADVERLEAHRISVREKLNVGSVTKTDLYRVEAELSKSKTDRVVAENRIRQSKAQLVQMAGVEKDFSISENDVPNELKNFKADLVTIQSAARENRYEIKEAEKALEVAKSAVKLKRGDYWPTLNLEAGYRDSEMTDENDITTESDSGYVSAELGFTLFDGGLRGAELRQAKANVRKARENFSMAKKNINLQSEVSFLEFETTQKTLINLQDELKSAEENFKAVSMQFKYGMADSIDMMDANTLLVTAQRRISSARYAYYQASLRLIHIQGNLIEFLLG